MAITPAKNDDLVAIAHMIADQLKQRRCKCTVADHDGYTGPRIFMVSGDEIRFNSDYCDLIRTDTPNAVTEQFVDGWPMIWTYQYEYADPNFPINLISRISPTVVVRGEMPPE